jgi:hypothetical protein
MCIGGCCILRHHWHGMTPSEPQRASLDERKFEEDRAAKKRELDLKEREIIANEREATAKEVELNRSRWLSPTVIGLFAATLGLVGNVIVARVNNKNTQDVERFRSQSNLVLEAIKTGNSDSACNNLIFFVSLGLLDDSNQTIRKQCVSAPKGPPSLPVTPNPSSDPSSDPAPKVHGIRGTVVDADTFQPIVGAEVIIEISGSTFASGTPQNVRVTDSQGSFNHEFDFYATGRNITIRANKRGYSESEVKTQDFKVAGIWGHFVITMKRVH